MSTGKGYLLPAEIVHDLICVTLKIPNAPEYRAAFRGQLKGLTEWWNWERRADKGNIAAADYWRQIINEHLIIQDCYELDFLGCDDMAQFEMCWFDTEGGRILRYTLNGGCTWVDVGNCDGGNVTVPPGEITDPVDPIDVPGTIPDPDYSPEVQCKVTQFAFGNILGNSLIGGANQELRTFTANAMLATPAEAPGAILGWLQGRGNYFGLTSAQYYQAYKNLYTKHYPNQTEIETIYDDFSFGHVECIVFDCLPSNGAVTRGVMDCISDGINALVPSGDSNLDKYYQFVADYIKIYPLEWARYQALQASASTEAADCSACVAIPEPGVCEYLAYIWANHALEETLGWVSITGGNPKQWAYGVCDFFAAEIQYPMSKIQGLNGGGWHLTQEAPPNSRRAGFIIREFDEPLSLCDFYATFFTKTNQNNTRMSVAWTRTDGVWTPLVANRKNINVSGDINLFWQGDTKVIDAILIGAWVGYNQVGSTLTIGNIFLNSALA